MSLNEGVIDNSFGACPGAFQWRCPEGVGLRAEVEVRQKGSNLTNGAVSYIMCPQESLLGSYIVQAIYSSTSWIPRLLAVNQIGELTQLRGWFL